MKHFPLVGVCNKSVPRGHSCYIHKASDDKNIFLKRREKSESSQKFVLGECWYEIGEEGNLIAGGAEVFESEVRR